MTQSPLPASEPDDPIAREVEWTPLSALHTTGRSYELVRDGIGRRVFCSTGRETARTAGLAFFLTAAIGVCPLIFDPGGARDRAAERIGATVPVSIFTLILLAMALLVAWDYLRDAMPAAIDARRREVWRAPDREKDAPDSRDQRTVPFDEIHALQVIRRDRPDVGELNLVLASGERVPVVGHDDGAGLARDARRIAEVIGVPTWEGRPIIPTTSFRERAERARERERRREERYLAARARELGRPVTFGGDMRAHLSSLQGLLLVLVNLVPLAGVLLFDWTVLAVFAIYWVEIIIAGTFAVLRLFGATRGTDAGFRVGFFAIPFVVAHFGALVWLQGWLIAVLFGGTTVVIAGALDLGPLVAFVTQPQFGAVIAVLVLGHLLSFLWPDRNDQAATAVDLTPLVTAPYSRAFVFHIALILGAMGMVFAFDVDLMSDTIVLRQGTLPTVGLVILVSMKAFIDLWAHTMAHKRMLMDGPVAASAAPGRTDAAAVDQRHPGTSGG